MGRAQGQRKQAARRAIQRDDRRARHDARKRRRRGIYLVVSAIIGILITISLFLPQLPIGGRGTGATSYKDGVGVPQALMPEAFHLDGAVVEYNTVPATSGDHWSTPTRCGFYEEELRDEIVVHNMEHGNVIMTHNLTNTAEIARLKEVHDDLGGNGDWLVTRPDSRLPDGDIAMTAWGVLDQLTGVDEERIKRFFKAYKGNRFSEETREIGRGISCASARQMAN